jgi:hypothetical protein
MASLQRSEQVLCGIPLWLIVEYLQELGGEAGPSNEVTGPGWCVQLEQVEDFTIGSIRVGQVRVVLEAEPDVYESLLPRLNKKLIRAGG